MKAPASTAGPTPAPSLWEAVLSQIPGGWPELLWMTAALLGADLALVWSVEAALDDAPVSPARLLVTYTAGGLLGAWGLRRLLAAVSVANSRAVADRMQRLLLRIDALDLRAMERLGVDRVHRLITLESPRLAQVGLPLGSALRFGIRAGAASLYLFTFAPQVAVFTSLLLGVVGALRFTAWTQSARELDAARRWRDQVNAALLGLVRGIAQVLLHRPRGDALLRSIEAGVERLAAAQLRVQQVTLDIEAVVRVLLYGLIGVTATVLGAIDVSLAAQVLIVIFFVLRAINHLVGNLTAIEKAKVAHRALLVLEAEVEAAVAARPQVGEMAPITTFSTLGLRQICFAYESTDAYAFGPVDLEIRQGEVLFVTGANGSGKSTCLKLLLGLYPPASGALLLDGSPIPSPAPQAWRDLFSVILSDFVLFERLLGLHVPAERANELLAWLDLSAEVQIRDGRFSTVDLSTGQRKRLAMVVALLQNRQVFVFDEWAADQDPELRDAFYLRILPDLKRRGKTIICVTHDEQFFHLADRRVVLDAGRIGPCA